ncbi:MAG: hypothetical protein D6788_11830, partial [Planctomycetota bacterium]
MEPRRNLVARPPASSVLERFRTTPEEPELRASARAMHRARASSISTLLFGPSGSVVLAVSISFLVLSGLACRSAAPVSIRAGSIASFSGVHAPGAPSLVEEGERTRVSLRAMINEVVSFRFELTPKSTPLRNASLHVRPFRMTGRRNDLGTSAAARVHEALSEPSVFPVTVYRMHRVHVRHLPGWMIRFVDPADRDTEPEDVLVPVSAPRGGLAETLEPGRSYPFWVDLFVPKGTEAGVYDGGLEVRGGGSPPLVVDITLEVVPVVLPDEADVQVLAPLDHEQLFRHHIPTLSGAGSALAVDDWRGHPEGKRMHALLRATLRELHRHRLTPVLPDLTPKITTRPGGELSVDWTAYDAVVGPLLDGRAFSDRLPLRRWPVPLSELLASYERPPTGQRDAEFSRRYRSMLIRYLAACADHFRETGWLAGSYVFLDVSPCPAGSTAEPSSGRAASADGSAALASCFERLADAADAVRRADPDLRVAAAVWPQSMEPYGWFGYPESSSCPDVDIWAPPAQFFDPTAMTR